MPIVADAAVAVRGDLKPFQRDLQGAGKQVDTLGGKIKNTLSPKNLLMGAGVFAAGFASVKLTEFLGDSVTAASDLNEVVSKTGQILGQEALPGLEEWAETASTTFGQSKRQALEGASNFAIFGKSAGLAGDDLAGFSTEMVELASDMASFHNSSPEEAITAIGAALRGENEPIRRFGVLLDDASLRAEALKQGLIETTSQALTPQQKVLAAHALILEQTTDAQGDFARTSDGLANSQRTLAASMEDAQAELGEKLLPIMLAFTDFLIDYGIPALSALGDVFDGLGKVVGAIADPFAKAGQGIDVLAMHFGTLGDRANGLAEAMGVSFGDIQRLVGERMARTGETVEQALLGIEGDFANASVAARVEAGEMMVGVGDAISAGITSEVEPEIKRLAKMPANMMAAENRAIRDAAFQHQVEYAKGLLDGQNEPKVQMEALKQMQKEVLTSTAEQNRLLGQLNSQRLADGLADRRPAVRAQAEATRLAIVNQLANLGINAHTWGWGIAESLASGMNNGYGMVLNAAGNLAAATRGQIAIESEPPSPDSPLRGITKWGGNIVKTIAEGITSELGTGTRAASLLAGSLVPGFGVGAGPSLASVPTAIAGGGNTYNVHLEDKLQARTVTEIGHALRRLGEAGLLPGSLESDR